MSRGKWKIKQDAFRLGFDAYNISHERYIELCDNCSSGRYSNKILYESCAGFEFLAPWIILSVTKNKSYDKIEYSELERIPASRTSFYRYRKLFYCNLDALLKEKVGNETI